MFDKMPPAKTDSLVEIGSLFRADPRHDKIDLGVGTYRDEDGEVRIMTAVKEAEGWHLKSQRSKAYLGPGGDRGFTSALASELFEDLPALGNGRLALVQTPGGTGAYRLALELAAYCSPQSTFIVGTPTWPNHIPVADRVGLRCATYRYYDSESGAVDFDAMLTAITEARPNDLFLIHGCCHNPTGATLSTPQWKSLAAALRKAALVPVIDLAYAGMAKGLEEDVAATRFILETFPEAYVAISCSKSFGLYNERTGMLAMLASSRLAAERCERAAEALARSLWSNPPDHGAAIVRTILANADLHGLWRTELDQMRERLAAVRGRLAASSVPGASKLETQEGLFAILPLDPARIVQLRVEHGIYMDVSGRINIAGLNEANIDRFIKACSTVTTLNRSAA